MNKSGRALVTSVIDGAAMSSGHTLPSTNPAHIEEVVAEVAFGDSSTFVRAAESAKKAQEYWAAIPAPIRGRAIAHIGRLVEDNAEALARLVTAEIGKPYGEALGEVREIIDTCDFFLGEGRRLYGQTVPSEMPDKQLFTFRRPVGTVAVITAGNFPVAVPAWYIVPALLAGNTVVWKPAEYSAASSAAFHELLVRGGGLPDGVFNVVHADGAATFSGLEQALEAGLLDKVGFTGSSAVGREIGGLTGRYLQTACLELGGKNPLIVTSSADLDLAVEGALFSGFGTA
ncbi:MAG TPA: aldehyde dehydrogenase family protein, partial [Propionibacteriaceae bacterium]|nr:aldehyde dehydrogenase family protein [Propionibacteriaceae bacterium]